MKQITVKAAREQRGWTQEQLEAASGVQQSIISRLERGESVNPTIDTVRKLEAALKLKAGVVLVFGDAPSQERVPA